MVTLTYGASAASAGNDDASGTLRVHANNFKLYNINVVNSYGIGSQALALSAYGTEQVCFIIELSAIGNSNQIPFRASMDAPSRVIKIPFLLILEPNTLDHPTLKALSVRLVV